MFKALISLHAALFICCCTGYTIWPQPTEILRGNTSLYVSNKLSIKSNVNSDILQEGIKRYTSIIFPFKRVNDEYTPAQETLEGLSIMVASESEDLQLGVSENYTLSISGNAAEITADTVFGALRGLETFSQLVDYDSTNKIYTISDTPIEISDSPRFPWRGLMIDTGRHFLEVSTILNLIDAAAYNKMNTLHWHMTDSQSFPLVVSAFPNLQQGAWAPEAVYTPSDITTVVQYGLYRGVRIIPELDIPGHAYSWGIGYPNLIINCSDQPWGSGGVTLNVTSDFTYEVIDGILSEIIPLFSDEYFHFGGDEVIFQCWNSSSILKDWMQANDILTFPDLEQYFENNLAALTNKHEISHRVFWEDAYINNNVTFDPATTTFEVWWSVEHLLKTVQGGYDTILANGFYLDVQQPGPVVHYLWVDTWMDFYSNEPFSGPAANLTYEQRQKVLGGETCMWGETVDDESIMPRIFIRASGAAEKLWSPMNFTVNSTNLDAAETRLIEFRCRLKQRGINACPVRPDYCPMP